LHLSDSFDPLQSLLMTFFDVTKFISSRSFLWYWCIIIRVLICSYDFFLIFPLSFLIVVICEQRVRERRKKKKEIWKAHQNFNDNTIDTIKKISMRLTNNTKEGNQQWTGCGYIAVQRQVSHPLSLDNLCGQLQSPSIIVLGGAEFTSLRSFLQYS